VPKADKWLPDIQSSTALASTVFTNTALVCKSAVLLRNKYAGLPPLLYGWSAIQPRSKFRFLHPGSEKSILRRDDRLQPLDSASFPADLTVLLPEVISLSTEDSDLLPDVTDLLPDLTSLLAEHPSVLADYQSILPGR
jgi:hypothetical protein